MDMIEGIGNVYLDLWKQRDLEAGEKPSSSLMEIVGSDHSIQCQTFTTLDGSSK